MTRNEATKNICVIGAGLAGSECAWQLAQMGYQVKLYEMRPEQRSPAHQSAQFAELVCSNSFGSLAEISAPGALKWEAEQLNSLILQSARLTQVPAGQALGVDREKFSIAITEKIKSHPCIEVIQRSIKHINEIETPAVIATGPLTSEPLAQSIGQHLGKNFLYFFDAIAPIIDTDSINMSVAWKADRYDKGSPDYINCPLSKEQYFALIEEIKNSRKIIPKEFDNTSFFEGCMPIETMVDRGPHTLRFGPMKPVGLKNPRSEREPYAVVQLRQENREATAYNMVGFQTRMTYPEQIRIFRMIPGLENAEFLKLGSIHRNLFINTPLCLNKDLSSPHNSSLFFAGQITGVEGYFESTCIGLLVAKFVHQKLHNDVFLPPPRDSFLGSLWHAITDEYRQSHFQPTNINFGLLPALDIEEKDKAKKKLLQVQRAKQSFSSWLRHPHSTSSQPEALA